MLIRKAQLYDMDNIVSAYELARDFMRESGNAEQWVNGYPQEEILRDDIARGNLYICEAGPAVFGMSSLTEPINGYSGNDVDTESMLEALEQLEQDSLAQAGIQAVFYFAIEDDPTYHEIDGAWIAEGNYGVVHRIAVVKRNSGVGTFCMEWALRKAQEAQATGGIRIDTHEFNKPMRNMLTKIGFEECGTIICVDGTPRIAYQKTSK